MSTFSSLNTEIETKLEPLLMENGGTLNGIRLLPFQSSEEIEGLLETYKPRLPFGLLSRPLPVYAPMTLTGGKKEYDANYLFAAVINTKGSPEDRERFYYDTFDLFDSSLANVYIGPTNAPTGWTYLHSQIDRAVPIDEPDYFAIVWNFSVGVAGQC